MFDREYDTGETCHLLKGQVRVVTGEGDAVVTFPAGLRCTWEGRSPVRKLYRFG